MLGNAKDPLQNLQAVQVQTIELCNRSCSFCPASQRATLKYGIMPLRVFHKVIDRLSEINYRGRISPDLMSECLLDDRIARMIRDLRSAFPQNVLFINTNGDRLLYDDKMFKNLMATGIDAVQINCYDNRRQFDALSRVIKKKIKGLKVIVYDKPISLTEIFKHDGVIKIVLRKVFGAPESYWNRGGLVPEIMPRGKFGNLKSCDYPSTQMSINYRGDCILCCSDWRYEVIFGNVNKTDIRSIWNSRRYQIYRLMHRLGKGKYLPLCNRCNRIIDIPR